VPETTGTGRMWFAPVGTDTPSDWTPIGEADLTWSADEPLPTEYVPLNRWTRVEVTLPIERPTLLLARIFGVPPALLGVPGYRPEDSAMRAAYRRRQLARRRRARR
jgi:hypothetical protein